MTFQREVAAFWTPGEGVIWTGTNDSGGSVEFDWVAIWARLRGLPELPRFVGMVHTHPPGIPGMSSTDRNMVYGWVVALGRPVRFTIMCDGSLHDYLCEMRDGTYTVTDLGILSDHWRWYLQVMSHLPPMSELARKIYDKWDSDLPAIGEMSDSSPADEWDAAMDEARLWLDVNDRRAEILRLAP